MGCFSWKSKPKDMTRLLQLVLDLESRSPRNILSRSFQIFPDLSRSPLAEIDGGRISTMFTTDAHLHVGPRALATAHGQFHEFAHAIFVQGHEGIAGHDPFGLQLQGGNQLTAR